MYIACLPLFWQYLQLEPKFKGGLVIQKSSGAIWKLLKLLGGIMQLLSLL